MEQKEREHFDNQLLADEPGKVSRGTDTLMKMLGVKPPPGAAPRPAEAVN